MNLSLSVNFTRAIMYALAILESPLLISTTLTLHHAEAQIYAFFALHFS